MSGINRKKIGEKIYDKLNKKDLLRNIKIFRMNKNAFEECMEDLYVCTVKGYNYKKNNKIDIKYRESGAVNNNYNDMILVICDCESEKIKKDDYFYLDSIKYTVVDKGNTENIIYNMFLNRM